MGFYLNEHASYGFVTIHMTGTHAWFDHFYPSTFINKLKIGHGGEGFLKNCIQL